MDVVETFEEGFLALTGYKPLAWQKRLFLEMFASKVPEAIDLPTGLGKTSVIPIWLLALSSFLNLNCSAGSGVHDLGGVAFTSGQRPSHLAAKKL